MSVMGKYERRIINWMTLTKVTSRGSLLRCRFSSTHHTGISYKQYWHNLKPSIVINRMYERNSFFLIRESIIFISFKEHYTGVLKNSFRDSKNVSGFSGS